MMAIAKVLFSFSCSIFFKQLVSVIFLKRFPELFETVFCLLWFVYCYSIWVLCVYSVSLVGQSEAVNHHHFWVPLGDQEMVLSHYSNFSVWGTDSKQNAAVEGTDRDLSILDFCTFENLNILKCNVIFFFFSFRIEIVLWYSNRFEVNKKRGEGLGFLQAVC